MVVPGKRCRYRESAVARLYTTVVDLCRLMKWINAALKAVYGWS